MKVIDAHVHLGTFGYPFHVAATIDGLIQLMDEFNVEKALCSSLENQVTLDAMRTHPDRIVGLVWLNPYQGDKAVMDLRTAVREQGFRGLKLHPLIHSFLPNDRVVYPLIEEAASLGIAVYIHSGHPPFSLPWSIGELAENFPHVTFVMYHMGHGHGVYIQAAIDVARRLPNVLLETSGMPMHTKIKEAVDQVGEDRVLYGSDIPFHHPSVEMQRVRVAGLTEAQLRKVFYGNAARLLNL